MRPQARALTLALLGVLASCGAQDSSPGGVGGLSGRTTTITFSIAVPEQERTALQEVISRFERRTRAGADLDLLTRFRRPPRTRVNLVTSLSSADLATALRRHDVLRTGPHLFAQDNLALKPLVDEALVEDLDAVEIPPAVLTSMVPPRFGGRQFFLPFRPNVRLTYVRKDALERAGLDLPRTVEELRTVAQRLRNLDGKPPMTLSLGEGDPAAVTLSEWVVSFGGDPLLLNDDGSRRAFEFLQRLWRDGLVARESLFAKFDTEVDNLRSDRVALAQNWSFTSAALVSDDRIGDFHVYPGWRGPARAVHVIGGDVLGLPRGITGEQREAALALARFLMSEEAQEILVGKNAWASIRSDAYDTVPDAVRETFLAIGQALPDGWFRPSVSYWPDVTMAMTEAVDRILLRQEAPAGVLDDLHGRVAEAARRKGEVYPPVR